MTGDSPDEITVETTGETVREAKWTALRELERRAPGVDKTAVRFQVLSEGERGLLGVGYAPARVIASAPFAEQRRRRDPAADADASDAAAEVGEVVERIAEAIGVQAEVHVSEDEDGIAVSCSGTDLGMLIGRHGQTIDAIQYLANAVAARIQGDERKEVVVDAAGYRERRRANLESLAVRTAERTVAAGRAIELEPMSAVERKIVHLRLKEFPGVETTSDGVEPNRYVVVLPARE